MPSRWICFTIIVFWLACTTWLIVQEVAPRLSGGDPPPYTIDLTDEVGANSISWLVMNNDERVGLGATQIKRLADRTFEFKAHFRFDRFPFMKLPLEKAIGALILNEQGEMQGFSFQAFLRQGILMDAEIKGKVEDDILETRLYFLKTEIPFLQPKPVRIVKSGGVLNPMMPLNRLPGLSEGQRWRIPLVNSLQLESTLPVNGLTIPMLEAEVHAAQIDWDGAKVSCLRIDYREPGPGNPVTASTWVRRRDGLVVQQKANYQGMVLTLVRDMAK